MTKCCNLSKLFSLIIRYSQYFLYQFDLVMNKQTFTKLTQTIFCQRPKKLYISKYYLKRSKNCQMPLESHWSYQGILNSNGTISKIARILINQVRIITRCLNKCSKPSWNILKLPEDSNYGCKPGKFFFAF